MANNKLCLNNAFMLNLQGCNNTTITVKSNKKFLNFIKGIQAILESKYLNRYFKINDFL